MSTMQRLTLIGMYNYDPTLFDGVTLPEGYDKQTLIDSLLLEHGEKCVMYTDVDFMKFSLGAVSRKWYTEFERIYKALREEYNPLWNYDRNEEYHDDTGGEVHSTQPESATNEHTVSAFNSSVYEPDSKDVSNAGHTKTESTTSFDHTAHLWGNIGVTTSATMAAEETRLRTNNNLYGVVANIFAKELLIQIY